MAKNFELKLYTNDPYNFGYPSLGSNYLPNLVVEERVARFLRNEIDNNKDDDGLGKYHSAIKNFLNNKTTIEKSGLLQYSDKDEAFIIYINDLLNVKLSTLTVTLISVSDLAAGKNVTPIQQPSFEYSKENGLLYIYPHDPTYKNYECLFLLTADIFENTSLLYTLVCNTVINREITTYTETSL